MTSRHLRNSTALAAVLAFGLQIPPNVSYAQDTAVDCAATPQACEDGKTVEGGENAADAPAAPAPASSEPASPENVRPAVDNSAPEAVEAAPEVAPETGDVVPEPVTPEAPAPVEAPAPAEPAPVEQEAQEEAPAAEPAEDAAPAEKPAPVEEQAPEVNTPREKPAEEPQAVQPAAPDSAPSEEAPAAEPAPVTEETPETTAPAEKPAASAPSEEKATPAEKPVVEPETSGEASTENTAADEAPAQETQVKETPSDATPSKGERTGRRPAGEASTEPGDPIKAQASGQPEEPAAVISDDATDAQRAQNKEREERRRDEARDRRLELLGAAAVGAGIGMLIPALGGKVVEDQGDRIIVERDGEYQVRKDESSLLRYGDAEVRAERLRGGRTRETVTRRNGVRIVTIRDEGGFILYRSRIMPDNREYVLIDNRQDDRRRRNYDRDLPPVRVGIPRERYIVPAGRASYEDIYDTFAAPPVEDVEQAYTLREVRESERLRDKMRRVDLDTVTFETGSAVVRQSQVPLLQDLARASAALIEEDPTTVLLIEGHTDAVGSEVSNLALSDRRAETVARILAELYDVPPENMVVQGYGESYLKIDTQGAEERNRRVTLRNITPLLSTSAR
ncbi:OmpA family protein [uncultured Roseibium sp.]|uniref:OmpA family protein n=1 Tax=uncultured Roseibium sp. TaxID=1936171 RepID=UPI002608D6E9|nr:OmpA family protein [uncultured Roseibium sp.]